MEEAVRDEFRVNLKNYIKQNGLKQNYVAAKCGYPPVIFNYMLNGKKIIKTTDVPYICRALNISPNYLFGYED